MILDAIRVESKADLGFLIILPSGRTLFAQGGEAVADAIVKTAGFDGIQVVRERMHVTRKEFARLSKNPSTVQEMTERDRAQEESVS